MRFAVCRLSVIPVRAEPGHLAEISSQVCGGEAVEILEETGQWWRVRLLADDYTGWVHGRQFGGRMETPPAPASFFTDDLCGPASRGSLQIALPLGAPLPDFHDGEFTLGGERWRWPGAVRSIPPGPPDKAALFARARRLLHAPYLWGGRTAFGMDCSGFVQSVMAAFGVRLPRDSKLQSACGAEVENRAAAAPGDLVFFGLEAPGISHVGLLLPGREIIHASTMVRLDDLTDEGIRSRESGELTHRTAAIRRVLE